MRYKALRKASFISIMVIVFLNILVMPAAGAKTVGNNGIKTISGWRYKVGESPVDKDSVQIWSKENIESDDWNYSDNPPVFPNSTYTELWVKFRMESVNESNFAIYFERIYADSFEIYLNDKPIYKSGTSVINKKYNTFTNIIIPVLEDHKDRGMTIRMESSNGSYIGIAGQVYAGEYKTITKEVLGRNIYGVVAGAFFIILSLVLFIVTMYFQGREKKALVSFGLAVLSTGLWNLIGFENRNILLPDSPLVLAYIYSSASMVTPVAFAYFFEYTFGSGTKSMIKRVGQVFAVYAAIYIILFAFFLKSNGKLFSFVGSRYVDYIFFIFIIVEAVILVISSIKASLKGNTDAKIFTFGALLLSISVVIYSLNFFINGNGSFIIVFGIFLFILSLVLIITRRLINDHKQLQNNSKELEAKNKDLNKAWIELKKSKDEIAKWNRTLESRVSERTQQLQESNKELQDALDKLQRTSEQLVQSEKYAALGELVAGIAHEINTPVGIGVTAASYLSEKTQEFAKLYKENKMKRSDLDNYLNTCTEVSESLLSNLQRASGLIKSFKQVAVDQSSEGIRSFNIREYMDEILLNLRPKLKRTKHRVNVICEEDFMIESYPGAISQVITNLIMNSLIHAYDEGDAGFIEIEITKAEEQLIVRYSDDGRGIPKENLDKIYDPFFTTKRGKGGTGLGLNIVYNIVSQKLGGSIMCESTHGEGTTFIISIPVEKGDIYDN